MCVGGLKTFIPPPEKLLVCVGGGGLKTETGKFLLHFQNSKSSNRCRSVYGTDITTLFDVAKINYRQWEVKILVDILTGS